MTTSHDPHISVAVVTPTWNREHLLPALHASLRAQTDQTFSWIVVDDASSDATLETLQSLGSAGSLEGVVLAQDANRGKAASLNRAFEAGSADVYLVIDSDDVLFPDAIEIVRGKATEYMNHPEVGALYFRYLCGDAVIGPELPQDDRILSRSANDAAVGKYDGAVAYFHRAIEEFRYPEFDGETYVGPTVLQLLMHPRYEIAFVNQAIGRAEYQAGGLTASGRALRIANPRGMTVYSRLQREQARGLRARVVHGIKLHAYAWIGDVADRGFRTEDIVLRPLGALLGKYWTVRHGKLGGNQ